MASEGAGVNESKPSRNMGRREFLKGAGLIASAAIPLAPGTLAFARSSAPYGDRPHPLRSPGAGFTASTAALPWPPVAVIALNRLAFGPRPGDLSAFQALGSSDEERLYAYIDQQLDPGSINDSVLEARLAEAAFTTLEKSLAQLWADHMVNNLGSYSLRTLPLREVERALFIRAVHSRRQLVEVLADFWHNHFSVYGWDFYAAPTWVHYDRDVIRGHLLGNFREMLEGVATSPAMLYYLDNYTNSRAGPNENWARELFELHTLGAENYLGVRRQNEVPRDGNGRPVGFVDDDVYEATRCFTGWTVANSTSGPGGNTGLFLYRDDWHDRFQKTVLGRFIPADQEALQDGRDVLDVLAAHPGTGRFICRKLCRRLIGDDPPENVVQSAAALFVEQKDAPDQLKQVVRHILRSPEFRTTWGQKVKRPLEAVVSALRAADADWVIKIGDGDSDSFMYSYGQCGQPPFAWAGPDGYPDVKDAWQSTPSLVMRWRMFNWLITVTDDLSNYRLDLVGQTPAGTRTPNELADFWIDRILGRALAATDRQIIVDFMAQGRNADLDLPLDTDSEVKDRLRTMVALIMMSPDAHWR
jgi:uncharacterized protein (DUF1800 family)